MMKIQRFVSPERDEDENIKIPPPLPNIRRGSMQWSRRPSVCGGEQLRMDDEVGFMDFLCTQEWAL